MYTIGRLAHRAQVTADSIRFYERQGLLAAATKTASGYKLYDDRSVRRLAFIKHAQQCGFNLTEIGELLLASDTRGEHQAGLDLAARKLADIRKLRDALGRMERTLTLLVDARSDAEERGVLPVIVAFEAASVEP
ncbi:MAG TPA: MerR family transcriptional regulator [Burkholderiales bacterium]|nr:MerR family transcriptional regulator [Burkholderiales bacterium]